MSNFDTNIMDWDSVIESDGQQFIILDEGDYDFTVTNFERGHYPGSAKLPPCNKASVTLTVTLPNGQTAVCRDDMILYRTLEWKISSFFRAIGQKKSGESMAMDWARAVGARGRAHFKPRSYESGGKQHTTNSVDHYYDAPGMDVPSAPVPAAPVSAPPVQQMNYPQPPYPQPQYQPSYPQAPANWVQTAEQNVQSGNVQQMTVNPQQLSWKNGGF